MKFISKMNNIKSVFQESICTHVLYKTVSKAAGWMHFALAKCEMVSYLGANGTYFRFEDGSFVPAGYFSS